MHDNSLVITKAILLDTGEGATKSDLLHKIASSIGGDRLSVKRIAIFERPFIARIYIEDMHHASKRRPWVLKFFRSSPKPDPEYYDYVVRVSLTPLPSFQINCAYSVESRFYPRVKNSPTGKQYPQIDSHIAQSISDSIFESLKAIGSKTAPSKATPRGLRDTSSSARIPYNTGPLSLTGVST